MSAHAYEFDEIAQNVFFPIYEAIARDALASTGIGGGRALDIGCGGGHLGLSLAKLAPFDVVLLDKDPDAVGIFTIRRKPFEDNVMMLRVLAKLVRAVPDKAARYQRAIDRTLRAVATPDKIVERGRFLGDFLLALEETRAARR